MNLIEKYNESNIMADFKQQCQEIFDYHKKIFKNNNLNLEEFQLSLNYNESYNLYDKKINFIKIDGKLYTKPISLYKRTGGWKMILSEDYSKLIEFSRLVLKIRNDIHFLQTQMSQVSKSFESKETKSLDEINEEITKQYKLYDSMVFISENQQKVLDNFLNDICSKAFVIFDLIKLENLINKQDYILNIK